MISYGFLGALTCPKKIPLVISLHGSDILIIPKRSWFHRQIAIFSLGRAKLITSVAQHMTDVLHQYVSMNKSILTSQYGINIHDFYPPNEVQPRLPIGLSTRAMFKVSHLEVLLQSAANLKELNFPLRFFLAGNGELQPSLEKLSIQLGIQEMVRFVGQVPPQEMPSILRQIAIYISTSVSDGTSLAMLEAMACGAFPVVTDIPANREWVDHGENGLLTQPGSSEDLAEKLMQAWNDEPLRRHAAAVNWDIVRERGDYHTNMQKIVKAFENLL